MQQFEFLVPRSLTEIVELMEQYGNNCKVVAGGTDIVTALRENRLIGISKLVDIRRCPELRGISRSEDGLWIGAGMTHSEIACSPDIKSLFPLLVEACSQIGSKQIRNLATLGGNVANASPAADSIPALLCLDAQVRLQSTRSKRQISLQSYLSEKKQRGSGTIGELSGTTEELVEGFFLPFSLPNTQAKFVKVARRQAMAISRLSLAILLHRENQVVDRVRLVPGAMLPVTQRLVDVENYLSGKELTSEVIQRTSQLASQQVIMETGRRSSFEYKIPVLEGLIQQVLQEFREGD